MARKSKKRKNGKKVALVFEDGSCLRQEDLEREKIVVFPKIEVKIPVKDGKIRF